MATKIKLQSLHDNFTATASVASYTMLGNLTDGNPISSIASNITRKKGASEPVYIQIEMVGFTITNYSSLISAEISLDTKCFGKDSSNILTAELRLVKPDLSVVSVLSRTITAVDSAFVTTGPNSILSNITQDGDYKIIFRLSHSSLVDTLTDSIYSDNINIKFGDGKLTQIFKNLGGDNLTGIGARPIPGLLSGGDSYHTSSRTAGHVSENDNHYSDLFSFDINNTNLSTANMSFDTKCTAFTSVNSLDTDIVLVKPDNTTVQVASRSITGIDTNFITTTASIISYITTTGIYKFRARNRWNLGASGSFKNLFDNVSMEFNAIDSNPSILLGTGQKMGVLNIVND